MTPALFADEPQHALVPLPSEQQCRAIIAKHGLERGTEVLRGLLARRRQIITLAETDPLHHAPRPPWWRLVDRCTRRTESPADRIKLMVLLGGNRSGKTRRCAHGIVKAALGALPCADGNNFLVGSQNLESSIAVAQRAVWHYLPPNIKALNGTRDKARGYFVNYSPKEGFSERVLVLPGNESRIRFETFNNDPADYEGWEFGCRAKYDVAWWFDEDAPWPWIDMAMRRGRFRPGYGMWSFTPINGITPAIREIASAGKVVIQRRAALLPRNRVVVEGCKPGHVPLLAEGKVPNSKVIYVHSDLSPFGSGTETYAESVRKVVAGKPEATILRIYYGYAKDVGGIAYPKFSRNVHVIPQRRLPAVGTNYHFIDPAGGRMWAQIYVRVAPGNPRRIYIFRDWPDNASYGAWAVPTTKQVSDSSREGWDGDPGPAQKSQGWGTTRYKQEILRSERIPMTQLASGEWSHADPQLRLLCDQAMTAAKKHKVNDRWTPEDVAEVRANTVVRLPVFCRYVDPRAAANPQAGEDGGTNLVELFGMEDRTRNEVVPGMELTPCYSGRGIDDGKSHVAELLDYDETAPLVPLINEPILYVTEECEQVIWTLENYTGRAGEKGACKDFADLVRYVAQCEDLIYVSKQMLISKPGFAY
mgnify:CR=1 FL=1|jgi:hypothetical protein